MKEVVLLHDEGRSAGLGHRRRVEAIALALNQRDIATELRAVHGAQDLVHADAAIVDSYTIRADDRRRVRARFVAALDDLGRNLAVDVLVDPSPGADASVHHAAGLVLAGADYAIVDPRVRTLATRPIAPGDARRVLVTFGAGPAAEQVGVVAAAIAALLPGAALSVAPEPSGSPGTASLAPGGFLEKLAQADLVVCAGGVTMLEALALGRPAVVTVLAENQQRAAETAAAAGAVVLLPMEEVASGAVELARDVDARRELSDRAQQLIDGLGASRVAEALLAEDAARQGA